MFWKKAFMVCCLSFFSSPLFGGEWKSLIDKELSEWTVWTGVPHETLHQKEWPDKELWGGSGKPIGDGDPFKLYTVSEDVEGDPILNISGEVYAGLTSKKEFSKYHLKFEVKWGEKKWEPRLNAPRDSGVLYHCQGEHGAFWHVWKQALECQVQENDNGDLYCIAKVQSSVPVRYQGEGKKPIYDPKGEVRHKKGSVKRSKNVEKSGEWNMVELLVFGDRALHVSNGEIVLALKNATSEKNGEIGPLDHGQIQIQSEGAEVAFRNVKIMEVEKVEEFPEVFQEHFK